MVEERCALITGAASGIGRCFANTLASQGWKLILVDIHDGRLKEVATALQPTHVRSIVVDVSSDADVRRAIAELSSEVERLDLLVNCAAILGSGYFAEQTAETFGKVIAVDVMGTVNMVHATLPWLRRARGNIVNMASTASLHGWPALAAYSAAKGAIENFSEAIRPELDRDGVGVTAVFPLLVDTPMLARSDLPPILKGRRITAEWVVKKTLRAVSRRRRRLYLPWTVRAIAIVHAIAPRVLDWWGARFGMPAQTK